MDYVFDPDKEAVNRVKHRVSLVLAEVPFSGPHQVLADDRFPYGEVRQVAFGRIDGRLFACVFTDRDGARRSVRCGRRTVGGRAPWRTS